MAREEEESDRLHHRTLQQPTNNSFDELSGNAVRNSFPNEDEDHGGEHDDEENQEHDSLVQTPTRRPMSLSSPSKSGTRERRTSTLPARCCRIWKRRWLPEGPWGLRSTTFFDESVVKFLKFFGVTISSLLFVHYYAVFSGTDRDESYGVREMILYDGNLIVLDILVFYVVGKLYQKASVDAIEWIVPSLVSSILIADLARVPGLHHSITPYEIHCSWGWQMWALIFALAFPLIGLLVGSHFVYAWRLGCCSQKLVELTLGLLIFLGPYASNSFFHLHHWYYGWVLGMHANHDAWWSRLTMACLWGFYLNGIALFGRDPILTCAVTLYQSKNQQCPYLVSPNYVLQAITSNSSSSDGESTDSGYDCSAHMETP